MDEEEKEEMKVRDKNEDREIYIGIKGERVKNKKIRKNRNW